MLMDISGAQDWHLTFSSVHEDLILVLPRAFGSIVLALLLSALYYRLLLLKCFYISS